MPQQQAFFLAELDPKTNADEQQADCAAQLSDDNGCAEAHQQQAGVNRMTHETIWAGANQFVVAFERHVTAPVSRERAARPQREEQPIDTNCDSNDLQQHRSRQDEAIHGWRQSREGQHPPSESDGDAMRERGEQALPFHRALRSKRTHQPDNDEDGPADDDDLAGDRGHRLKFTSSLFLRESQRDSGPKPKVASTSYLGER